MHTRLRERRYGARMATDFRLVAFRHGHPKECRALDLSASGALIRRRRPDSSPLVQRVRLEMGGATVTTYARTVWSRGGLEAVRFVGLSDVDRLEIAEHLDRLEARRRVAA